ncbi:hypothetical protein PYCC9005_001550 [Savitreella phatthalungensis]
MQRCRSSIHICHAGIRAISYRASKAGFRSQDAPTFQRKGSAPPASDLEFLYGRNAVVAALGSDRRCSKALYVSSNMNKDSVLDDLAARRRVFVHRDVPKDKLNQLSDNKPHNGVVLSCKPLLIDQIDTLPLPRDGEKRELIVLLDEISDPQNLGSILRSAYFLGVDAVIMSSRNCSTVTPTVVKVSSGASEFVNLRTTRSTAEFVKNLRAAGWSTVAAVAPDTAKSNGCRSASDFSDKHTCLVLGSEGYGLRAVVASACEFSTTIESRQDLAGGVDSLNVGAAAAILFDRFLRK